MQRKKVRTDGRTHGKEEIKQAEGKRCHDERKTMRAGGGQTSCQDSGIDFMSEMTTKQLFITPGTFHGHIL